MNRLLFVLASLVFVFAACTKKTSINTAMAENPLQGKWIYTESYISPGGPTTWRPVQPANQVIEFRSDGSFSPSVSFLSSASRYELTDSARVRFSPTATASGHTDMQYEINTANGTLILHQIDPICIEGCSYKFKRYGL